MYILDIKLSRYFEIFIVMLKFMFLFFFLIMEVFFICNYVILFLIVFISSCYYINSFLLLFNFSINTKFKKKMYNFFFKGRFIV